MAGTDLLLELAALVAATGTALAVDWMGERRGLLPPGFAVAWRRALAASVLALLLYLTVFGPLAAVRRVDPAELVGQPWPTLFIGHAVLLLATLAWAGLAFTGSGGGLGERARRELGLASARPWADLAAGLAGGAVAWLGMVAVVLAAGALAMALGQEDLVPGEAPEVIAWLTGLPLGVRVALCLSAGAVEELFFRGLLQPRLGVALSTAVFLLAHGTYEAPLMLVGLAWVSLVLAALVVRRRNLLAAMVAHALFDLVQLLVVIPWALRQLPAGGAGS